MALSLGWCPAALAQPHARVQPHARAQPQPQARAPAQPAPPRTRQGRAPAPAAASRRPPPLPDLPPDNEVKLPILVRLGDVLLASGQVTRAIHFYDRFRFNFDDQPLFWRRFAALYEQAGDLERALACLEHVARLEINVVDDAIKEAELLWRLQRPAAAIDRLLEIKPHAEDSDRRYWQLLFDLAWADEREPLATESLQMLWQHQHTLAAARDLCHLLAHQGQYGKGAQTALETLEQQPDGGLLLLGMRLAVEGRRYDLADALLDHAGDNTDFYQREADFFLARAFHASLYNRATQANRDFEQAASMTASPDQVCPPWLEASVALEDRVMAESALERCRTQEARRPSSWDLLADVHAMMGGLRQAAHWRTLAREQSGWADPAAMADRPPGLSALEHQLLDAIERDDKPGVQRALDTAPGPFRLPTQVAALQALDRPDEAWRLLEGAGFAARDAVPTSREDAVLVKKALRMRSDWLSGVWARSEAITLGDLRVLGARAWVEQRFRPLYLGLEVGQSFLQFAPRSLFQFRSLELEAGAWLRHRRASHDTKFKGGVRLLGRGDRLPYARLTHQYLPPELPLHLEARAFIGELPVYTALLRAAAVRDGGEVTGGWRFGNKLEASGSVGVSRFALRDRRLLSSELSLFGEVVRRIEMEYWTARPRLFVSHNARRNQPGVSGVLASEGSDPAADEEARRQVQLGDYSSVGLGASLGNDFGVEPQARGPRRSYRYSVSGWAATVVPTMQLGYGLEAHFGFVFARRQELGASVFFYGGWREAVAERYGGASLSYVARWF
jgi:tetratricopeptide (TPR) repeat protein